MKISLGAPELVASPALSRRLALLTGLRLVFLTLCLALVGLLYLRGASLGFGSTTLRLGLGLLIVSFALAGGYAALLRVGRGLAFVADAQIVFDQLTWTVVAYLTGGASSGAASLYGLSCLVGAAVSGSRGAALAAGSGVVSYASLVVLLAGGWLAPPPDQPASIYRLSAEEVRFYLAVNALVMLVVALLAGTLAERLRWTGGELQMATERAERAERMAALGRLAAGLAHEIRNPLGSIAGSIALLRSARGLTGDDQQLCDIIAREADRLNDLVTDMMDLTRPRRPDPAPVDIALIAHDVVELATRSGRAVSDVKVVYEGPASLVVQADGAQLRQLVWNLVRNGVQASRPGGLVRVVLENKPDGASLAVVDRGVGIDEEARSRLFDAFFTTRSHGTGVGLAVVKSIADEHGFAIDVESGAGQGATFRVNLGRPLAAAVQPSS
ncbi:MAG TPA: ATP-binding protein [Polyangiaceae bacterium]|nr:ATP-binding protein [Polyangiaceae bacterium]